MLAGYLTVSLAINLQFHRMGSYAGETDFYGSFAPQARRMLQGELPIDDFRGPLYPFVLAGSGLILGDFFKGGVVVSTVAAALMLWCVFGLYRRLADVPTACGAVLLVGLNRTFVEYSYTVSTDLLFTAVITVGTYLLLKDPQCRWRNAVLSAFCVTLGYLTRYNGIFALLGVPAALLGANPYRSSWRMRAATAAVFGCAMLTLMAPWGLYCLRERGSFFYNKNYLNVIFELYAQNYLTWEQYWGSNLTHHTSLGQVLVQSPVLVLGRVFHNLGTHLALDGLKLAGWPVALMASLGLIQVWRRKCDGRWNALLVLGAVFFAVLVPVFYMERFSLYLLPIYCGLAVLGARRGWPATGFEPGKLLGQVVLGGLFLWTLWTSYSFNRTNIASGPTEILDIAEKWKDSGGANEAGARIVARKPQIAYYLGLEPVNFPYVESTEDLMQALKEMEVSYLYFGTEEARRRPQLTKLLDPDNGTLGLRPVLFTRHPTSVLYRLEAGSAPNGR